MANILLSDPNKVSLNELKRQRRNETNARIRKRLSCIITSIEEQKPGKELAKCLDYGKPTICRWINAYNSRGIAGLGLNCRVGDQESSMNRTSLVLEQRSPREYGFVTETWDCKMLAEFYAETWKKQVSDETIRRLLKRNNFSFKQSQFQHPKADLQAKKSETKI